MSIVFLPAYFILILYAMDVDEALRIWCNFEVTPACSRRLDHTFRGQFKPAFSCIAMIFLQFFCNSLILEAFLREKRMNL